jgi:hypothetical protein
MNKFEENSNLEVEGVMEIDELDNTNEIIGEPLNFINNSNIFFIGFYDKTSNSFYKMKEFKSKKFKIKRKTKELEIKYSSNENKHSRILLYNLLDNCPSLIRSSQKDNNINVSQDIIIHFTYSPTQRKKYEYYNDTSSYLLDNYNLENNLLCLNCPYKTIFIPKCSKDDLEQIYNQLFFHEKREIVTENEINVLSFDDYKIKIRELKEKINIDNKNDFYDLYASYSNISETIDKREFESIFSIYNNFKNEFKIEKNLQEKKTIKIKNKKNEIKKI